KGQVDAQFGQVGAQFIGSAKLRHALEAVHLAVLSADDTQPPADVAQNVDVAGRPAITGGVRRVAGDPSAQLEKLGGTVLVGGHGAAEGKKAQILQQVVEFEEGRVACRPQRIAPGEEIGRKGA